jgi:ferric-dicitrate binding protein FerR (iron transport regulator)
MMDDKYSPLLFVEERSEEQDAALREVLEEDPDLARQWTCWVQVRKRLRERLQDRMPDRRLLVLYALEQEGAEAAFTPAERRALAAARGDIAEAIDALPALGHVVARIRDERGAFEEAWAQHQDERPTAGAAPERPASADRTERAPRRPRSREDTDRRWAWRLTVAALLLGAAVLALVYGPQRTDRATVTAQAGERKTVSFEDGSTARLVGVATLSYTPGTAGTDPQRVRLARGRAYFNVPPSREAPFVVRTPTAQAEVLGTQFGVATGRDTTEVVLVEGAVRVEAEDDDTKGSVVLGPGERSLVRRGHAPSAPSPANLTNALAWSGLFVFRSAPVSAIAEQLREHYDVSIAVAPTLADEPVTGTLDRDQSVAQVLTTLARTLGAEVRTDGQDAYRLVPVS